MLNSQIYSISQRSQLYFSRVQPNNSYNNRKKTFTLPNSHSISLLSDMNNILTHMPKHFTITTKNSSCKFSTDFLIETSTTISNFIKEIHNDLKYNLDIEDPRNVLGKYEQLYEGKPVIFEDDDLPTSQEITEKLFIVSIPNFLKPKSMKCSERGASWSFNPNDTHYPVEINGLNQYLKKPEFQTFSIITKKNKYKCNIFGVYLSDLIRTQLENEPSNKEYFYEIDDENNEFQPICDLFNFNIVEITKNNMDSLKEIAEDLKIECILKDVNKYINDSEKVTQTIDDQLEIIDSIDELFDWLCNINDLSVVFVKNSILQSVWIESEENVQELTAFIIEVARTDILLHTYLVDLIILLIEQANDSNFLDVLKPFLVSKLMSSSMPCKKNEFSFNSYIVSSQFNQIVKNPFIYAFIYRLYKRGVISKNEIVESLKNYKFQDRFINMMFLPLLIEMDAKNIDLILPPSSLSNENTIPSEYECNEEILYINFLKSYLPDKLDLYEKMLDSGEPDDILTKSLRHDDVDTVQSILSRSQIKVKTSYIPFNIYDNFSAQRIKYINYAAAFGSLKCFKYLLLNHDEIDENTFQFAVYGGNNEIIKIVDQSKQNGSKNASVQTISNSIVKHRNNLFDWILAKDTKEYYKKSFNQLALKAADHGNAHVLADIIDKGFDIQAKNQEIIQKASRNGFFRLTKFILKIANQKEKEKIIHLNNKFSPYSNNSSQLSWINSIYYGNLSIFKLFCKKFNNQEIESAICFAVEKKYMNVIDFFIDELIKGQFKVSPISILKILSTSLMGTDVKFFNYLLENFKNSNTNLNFSVKFYMSLLENVCKYQNFEAVKIITEIILNKNSNEDFSPAFGSAASIGSIELCRYFIDKKVKIDYDSLTCQCNDFGLLNEEIFSYIINKVNPQRKNILLSCIKHAITSKNKELVDYLFRQKAKCENALILAVNSHDLELVDIILKYNNKPYFVNKMSFDGSALINAVKNRDLPIVKRLLSVPGIDPSLYTHEYDYPLLIALNNCDIDILNAILDFYGDDIQYQRQQLDRLIQETFHLYYMKYFKQNKKILPLINRVLEIKFIDPNYLYPDANQINDSSDEDNYPIIVDDQEAQKSDENEIEIDDQNELDDFDNFIFDEINSWNVNVDDEDEDDDDDNNNNRMATITKETFLLCACYYNDIEMVKKILNLEKVDVNKYSFTNGDSPLIVSIKRQHFPIAKLLIEHSKTNINYRNFRGKTALTIAVKKNLTNIVDLLIKNEKFDPQESRLNYAFNISNWKISKQFITSGLLDVNDPECFAFAKAVKNNDIEITDFIIHHPSFDKIKSHIEDAIIISIRKNNFEIFKKLLQLVDNDVNLCDLNGKSLLSHSICSFNEKVFNFILNDEKFDSKKSNILKAFTETYSNPKIIRVQEFLQQNQEEEENENDNENDLIIGNHNNFTNLIQNRFNRINKIPIDNFDMINIMEKLYNYDKEHYNLIDFGKLLPSGNSFFTVFFLSFPGIEKVSNFLIEHGVDPNAPDSDKVYPLEKAIEIGSYEFVLSLINTNKIDFSTKIPKKNGNFDFSYIDLETANFDNGFSSYLHLAARSSNPQIIDLFLERDLIDVNITDDLGNTPLMEACIFGRYKCFKKLFQKDNLDYLHVNNEGKDALAIFDSNETNENLKLKRNRSEYYRELKEKAKLKNTSRWGRLNF